MRFFWVGVLALGQIGCGSSLRPDAPTANEASGRDACGVDATGRPAPLIVDWQPEHRMDLEAAMGTRGLAVVHWDCPTLRVVSGCYVDGDYDYAGASPKEQVIRMEEADEVRLNLPLTGASLAAQLEGSMERGTSLNLGLVMVGKKSARGARFTRDDLKGRCDGATHVVQSATLGAFALATGSHATTRTVAQVFEAEAGGASRSLRSVQTRDGELGACNASSTDAPVRGCDAVLRVELSEVLDHAPTVTVLDADFVEALRGRFCADPEQCRSRCADDDASACHDLGIVQLLGDRVPRDLGRGTKNVQRACDLGHMNACTLIGITYLTQGPRADAAHGRKLLERPCERGVAAACSTLAVSFTNSGEDVTARRYWDRACDLGDSDACKKL